MKGEGIQIGGTSVEWRGALWCYAKHITMKTPGSTNEYVNWSVHFLHKFQFKKLFV